MGSVAFYVHIFTEKEVLHFVIDVLELVLLLCTFMCCRSIWFSIQYDPYLQLGMQVMLYLPYPRMNFAKNEKKGRYPVFYLICQLTAELVLVTQNLFDWIATLMTNESMQIFIGIGSGIRGTSK